jgi:hypothetical protein
MARRVRNANLPMGQRVNALHWLLANHHAPLGFRRTRAHLRRATHAGLLRRWNEPSLLAALDMLEESRASHLAYRAAFAERRRIEKASGQRVPTKGDVQALARSEWLMDIDDAAVRRPSVRELRKVPPSP